MKEDRLKELLQKADRTAPVPRVSPDLAKLVQKAAGRRRKARIAASLAAAAMAAVGITITGWLTQPGRTPVAAPQVVKQIASLQADTPEETSQLRAELDELRREIDARMAIIEQMIVRQEQRERLAKLERRLAELGDPLEEVKQQLEKAACTIVYYADRKYNELNLIESAIADYQQVIKLYPQTIWAQKAQNRLENIENQFEGDLL